jgi:hypothetical protein
MMVLQDGVIAIEALDLGVAKGCPGAPVNASGCAMPCVARNTSMK